jgi:hypothetical protein
MDKLAPIEISQLGRKDYCGEDLIETFIYRTGINNWTLRVENSRGASAVWKKKFKTPEEALAAYTENFESTSGGFMFRASSLLKGLEGFNSQLLRPKDLELYDPRTMKDYVLRTFEDMRKYSGIWPIQNLRGHMVTGYLYAGEAAQWPHCVVGLPKAPMNILEEFAIPVQHIKFNLLDELGLKTKSTRSDLEQKWSA